MGFKESDTTSLYFLIKEIHKENYYKLFLVLHALSGSGQKEGKRVARVNMGGRDLYNTQPQRDSICERVVHPQFESTYRLDIEMTIETDLYCDYYQVTKKLGSESAPR